MHELGRAAFVAAACLWLRTALAVAHSGATGVVKERMDLMKAIGGAMKSLTEMMRSEKPYDAQRVRADAEIIVQHGGDAMTALFPEGSLEMPSEAKAEIWQDWDRFAALADRMTDFAEALGQAADNQRMGSGAGMMGGGMMSGDRTSGGMMGGGMMQGAQEPDPAHLAAMPPEAAFRHLAEVCSACHEDFRVKQ